MISSKFNLKYKIRIHNLHRTSLYKKEGSHQMSEAQRIQICETLLFRGTFACIRSTVITSFVPFTFSSRIINNIFQRRYFDGVYPKFSFWVVPDIARIWPSQKIASNCNVQDDIKIFVKRRLPAVSIKWMNDAVEIMAPHSGSVKFINKLVRGPVQGPSVVTF